MEQIKQVKEQGMMNEQKQVKGGTMEQAKKFKFDFSGKFKDFKKDDFCNYDFKKDYVLSIRLSYGDEKQKEQVYKDYINFLQLDLQVMDISNKVYSDFEKSSSYYYVFKKSNDFNEYFEQLEQYKNTLDNTKDKDEIEKIDTIIQCKNDLYDINFTISNFKEIKDKVLNFINFCKSENIIKYYKDEKDKK